MGGGGGGGGRDHLHFVAVAPMTLKFGTSMELDTFYTMAIKMLVTSCLFRNYYVMFYPMHRPRF